MGFNSAFKGLINTVYEYVFGSYTMHQNEATAIHNKSQLSYTIRNYVRKLSQETQETPDAKPNVFKQFCLEQQKQTQWFHQVVGIILSNAKLYCYSTMCNLHFIEQHQIVVYDIIPCLHFSYSKQNQMDSNKIFENNRISCLCGRQCWSDSLLQIFCSNGCETRSLTLWKERRLRIFEDRVLRRIFGPKRFEVTGEWRKLHNEQLNDLYCSPNIVRVIKQGRM